MKNPKAIEPIVPGSQYLAPTYVVTDEGLQDGPGVIVVFCKGNKEDASVPRQEGLFTETVIQIAKEQLEAVNVGRLETKETTQAILKLEEALMWLNKRQEDRKLRNVQGTYQK